MTSIGAHIHRDDPLATATAWDADVVQFFLGDPQDWKAPVFPADPAALKDAFAQAGVGVYIHAPYRINVATTNNRIRIPSRKLLGQYLAAAAEIGAAGVIVHGGHVDAGADVEEGFANWQKAVERIERPVPMLIENTAGGDRAMARGLTAVERLWEAIAAGLDDNIGFCLDTCHAHAGGEDLDGIVDRVKAITGRIDLVHLNNSRDERGSGRDRHAGITDGEIDPKLLLDVLRGSGAPAVCETPDPATDIRWLREHLAGDAA
ncbi:MAG TPA: deoxyribonuclease IV [Streptosporangiaceae bacterium]|jgi:deoxyribonuclease-4|nr:deoxyribonuclease IV [Streptosporangiaceae bacterium]